MDVESGRKQKAAAASGKNKANRQAQMAQNRGLQSSGKATNKQVKKQTSLKTGGGGAANAARNAKKGGGGPKMVISFNPNDLNRTTDPQVRGQILGVLSKAPKGVMPVRGGPRSQGPKAKSRSVRM